jgi:peptidoglycan hydrolase FlgJ
VKLHGHVAAPGQPSTKADPTHTAAKQLEAFFLRQMLTEAKPSGSDDGGFAGDTFKQMFNEAIADKMSDAGGIGMADIIAKQLSKGSLADNADAMMAAKAQGGGLPLHNAAIPAGMAIDRTSANGVSAVESVTGGGGVTGPRPAGYDGPALVMPVVGRPSSGYGMRTDPVHGGEMKHPGFDLAAPTGTKVSAAAEGTVTHAGPAGTYGNLVTIKHASGYETRYAHLSAVSVHVGDQVAPGTPIGAVGTTGYSTGPHLHFEVRHDGQTIDPAPLLPLNKSPSRTNR